MSVCLKEDGILCLQVGVRTLPLLHLVIYNCLGSQKVGLMIVLVPLAGWACSCTSGGIPKRKGLGWEVVAQVQPYVLKMYTTVKDISFAYFLGVEEISCLIRTCRNPPLLLHLVCNISMFKFVIMATFLCFMMGKAHGWRHCTPKKWRRGWGGS
jgi:hypothetical protein